MIDLTRSPFIVIWQAIMTCALACAHCQAEAIPRRNPGELSALVLNYGGVFSGHYRSH
jgi:MoaA/NifB/PqqE/SkfB family radical SAM enzyme